MHNELMELRPLDDEDRPWVAETVSNEWGLPIVSISGRHNPAELAGFVAIEGDERLGLITYRTTDEDCEVVTLNSFRPRIGTGTALLRAVKQIADDRGLSLWLITTDENSNAIRFYEHCGMARRALHRDFVEVVRRYKPDSEGYRDAIEFSYRSSSTDSLHGVESRLGGACSERTFGRKR
jgi:ribosomal protein S18 acetylase RimI-like enzyme